MNKLVKENVANIALVSFLKDFIYLFLERGGGRRKQRERNIDVREKHQSVGSVASQMAPTGNQTLCPDRESKK